MTFSRPLQMIYVHIYIQVRQLLDRRRAVRVVRLVNRVQLPFHRGDADDVADVQREVLRRARVGI